MFYLNQTTSVAIVLLITLPSPVQSNIQNHVQNHSQSPIQGQARSVPMILAEFNPPPPPSTGRPGRRSDAGSRGCGGDESSAVSGIKSLLALVPTQETADTTVVFGKTAAERPTFWFYVPYGDSVTATFVLQDQQGNPIYQADVPLPPQPGILSLTLPETVAPLAPNQLYHWFLKLYCRSTSPPISFVDGQQFQIQKIRRNPVLGLGLQENRQA